FLPLLILGSLLMTPPVIQAIHDAQRG
uniref:Glycyl-poneratoxin n=1 Tax=Paraponera clavata TaxID=55425 RepID=TX1A_PARCV|nr:RecName: Full=Glycyl-poneratoxin; Short=Glycyl-PoTx; Contains: RecName: Full=Delta-paraponeritoxin-Pc1a; Short=Delta-PPOTX-Pc1a; AltName: Full=Pac-TX; AltName: Full=Poneratoxin; Short=PoTX; AltName: Full=Poneritoxin [Paraponera clavata]